MPKATVKNSLGKKCHSDHCNYCAFGQNGSYRPTASSNLNCDIIKKFIFYLTGNTLRIHHKDQLLSVVEISLYSDNNTEPVNTFCGRMQRS